MLTSITLQNFKSFGEAQTVALRSLTVLVGPNNAGKSNFVSLGRFMRNIVKTDPAAAIEAEGGAEFLVHRPPVANGLTQLGWSTDGGGYSAQVWLDKLTQREETLLHQKKGQAWSDEETQQKTQRKMSFGRTTGYPAANVEGKESVRLFSGLRAVMASQDPDARLFREVLQPVVDSREVNLVPSAMRQDAEVVPEPRLGEDGANLASVLGLWRGAEPERAERLNDLVRRALPEIRHLLVKPSPRAGYQRLWVQQGDGEQFDARHLSDGILSFIAMAMHVIEAQPNTLVFMDEPERWLEPLRLRKLVELFRQIAAERQCQVVFVTHSPAVLYELREEPESIVLFRREDTGTRVKPLTEISSLREALKSADPGEALTRGLFDTPFKSSGVDSSARPSIRP